jgi:riboflavin kinase/FMN adenylyltransferase
LIDFFGLHPECGKDFVVCLGFFDGVHCGHRALINAALKLKASDGFFVCVHTYRKSPAQVLFPNQDHQELTSLDEKKEILFSYGADTVAVSTFDEKLIQMSGEDFLDNVLLKAIPTKALVVGHDHRFGQGGKVDAAKLKELCDQRNLQLIVVPPVKAQNGLVISSSAIKEAIKEHNYLLAQEMLGRPLGSHLLNRQ